MPNTHGVPGSKPGWTKFFYFIYFIFIFDLFFFHSLYILNFISFLASLNQQDNQGRTPLHWAANHASTNSVITLIERGADMTMKGVEFSLFVKIKKNIFLVFRFF
jgi:ankyrin repeat protein